jgi:hypothetical protein
MANVAKILEIVFGANPTQDDLREIVRVINERLPAPIAEPEPKEDTANTETADQPSVQGKNKRK